MLREIICCVAAIFCVMQCQASRAQIPFRIEIDGFALQYDAEHPLEQNVLFDMRQPDPNIGRHLPEIGGFEGPAGTDFGGSFDEATPVGEVRFYENEVLVFSLDRFFFVDFRQVLPELPAASGTVVSFDHLFGFDLIFAGQETLASGSGNDGWLAMDWLPLFPFDVKIEAKEVTGSLRRSISGSGKMLANFGIPQDFTAIPTLADWHFFPGDVYDVSYQSNAFVSNTVVNGSELVAFDHAPDGDGSLGFSAEISGVLYDPSNSATSIPEPSTLAMAAMASLGLALRRGC